MMTESKDYKIPCPLLLLGGIVFMSNLLRPTARRFRIPAVVGTTLPARPFMKNGDALLLGVSMVPRAEIIMTHGLYLGDRAVPPILFSAMVPVVVAASLFTPFFLKPMLRKNIHAITS